MAAEAQVSEVPIERRFFKSLFSRCRVSCVKFLDHFIIAGVGDVLHIYNINTKKIESKKQILQGQNIYGITFLEDSSEVSSRAIIWGGKEFSMVSVSFNGTINVTVIDTWLDSIWIWDVKWFDANSFLTVGMNNSVTLWKCSSKSKESIAYCEDQCIVYSGKIIGASWTTCVILVGTVMQNILIWKPTDSISPTLFTLKGHKGAIFSVNYCPKSNLIVSTSDDRTVRFWKVNFKTENDWTTANIALTSTIFGHTARVWQSAILNDSKNKNIISVGEDGMLCAWTEKGENTMRKEAHQGASICAVDVNASAGLIVTGGADGGLCLWSVTNTSEVETNHVDFNFDSCLADIHEINKPQQSAKCDTSESVILGNELSKEFNSLSPFSSSSVCRATSEETSASSDLLKNFSMTNSTNSLLDGCDFCPSAFRCSNLKSLVLVKSGNVIASLDKGFLLGSSLNSVKWKLLFYDRRFSNYHLLSVSTSRKFVSLASICGTVLLFQDNSSDGTVKITLLSEVQINSSKIFSIHWLSDEIFVTCVAEGLLELWHRIDENDSTVVERHEECILPANKERWLTCASLSGLHLLCGDRIGSIYFYDLETSMNVSQTFKKIHQGGVCDVRWNEETGEAYSIGRDGYIRHWTKNDAKLELLLTEKLPIKWPTRIFLNQTLGIIVHGFTANQVIVWSYNERKILLREECGGGHRSWDCILNEKLVLVWIKDKSVHVKCYPVDNFSNSVFLEGFHCKEINSLTVCKTISEDGEHFDILLTGSEDTTLRISSITSLNLDSQSNFFDQCVVRSHVSSIRALASISWGREETSNDQHSEDSTTFSSGNIEYLIVSAGGRAQIKVWSLTMAASKIKKMVELASHMLRGDDRSRRTEKQDSGEPEARYMAVDVVCLSRRAVFIFTACSDGVIRIFHFSDDSRKISVVAEIYYHEACILGIRIKQINKDDQKKVFRFLMLTMTTEGVVAVWEIVAKSSSMDKLSCGYTIQSPATPLFTFDAHQSGINSHDLQPLGEAFILATGGDDTAITLSYFLLDEKRLVKQFTFDCAHEAQVSGILFCRDNPWIFTTSTDQRIILWAYTYGTNLSLQYVAEYQSFIADIHGLSFLDPFKYTVCVYGCGLELVTFEKEIYINSVRKEEESVSPLQE
nr:PREDICTED: WD repeat-containing protein 6 [Bemisia tabaci]